MAESGESETTDVILGEKGRFAIAFKKTLGSTAKTINNIEENTNIDLIRETLSKSQKSGSKVNIYWCLGKAKSRSERYLCDEDFTALNEFLIEIESLCNKNMEFIYLSSGGSVYGNSAGSVNENSKLNPQSYYAEMKIKSEILLKNLSEKSGMRVSLFRLANAYSIPRIGSSKGIVESLIDCLQNHKEFELSVSLQSKKQYATYCNYSSNIMQYLRDFRTSSTTIQVQNLFSNQVHTVKSLIDLVEIHFESQLKISEFNDLSEESVILESVNKNINQNSWISVQDFLSKCYPKS